MNKDKILRICDNVMTTVLFSIIAIWVYIINQQVGMIIVIIFVAGVPAMLIENKKNKRYSLLMLPILLLLDLLDRKRKNKQHKEVIDELA